MAAAKPKHGLIGIFAYHDDVLAALKALQGSRLRVHTVYSPVPSHALSEALQLKPSPVRFFTLSGGLLGILTAIVLVVYTSAQWNFIVSGKPVIPAVPTVIVAFELCILLGIFGTLLGMLTQSRLPRLRLPGHYDPRFTEDRFGIRVVCGPNRLGEAEAILRAAGAEDIHEAND